MDKRLNTLFLTGSVGLMITVLNGSNAPEALQSEAVPPSLLPETGQDEPPLHV